MVEQFIISMYTTMISWTYILLTVLIVVKIIQLIGKIGEGGFKWPSWGGGDGGGRGGDRDEKKTIPDEDKEYLKKNPIKGLDVNNPGQIQILVVDIDGNPLPGAEISITPANLWKRNLLFFKGQRRKEEWREYKGFTDSKGFWPGTGQYEKVGSGALLLRVHKKGFKNITWWSNKSFYEKKVIDLAPGETLELLIRMQRRGEKGEWFEPHIKALNPTRDGNIELKGVIE